MSTVYPLGMSQQLFHYYIQIWDMGVNNNTLACLYWICACVLWVLGFIYPNEHKIDIVASSLSRGAALFFFNAFYIYLPSFIPHHLPSFIPHLSHQTQCLSPRATVLVTIRHLFMTFYGFAFAQAQFYLPSPIIYTIYFSGPMFVVFLDFLVFKKTITRKQGQGMVLTLAGVMLTSNGAAILSWITGDTSSQTSFQNYKTDSFAIRSLVAAFLFVLTFGWAAAILTVRTLKRSSIPQMNANFGVVILLLSGILFLLAPANAMAGQPVLLAKCMLFSGLALAVSQHFYMAALVLTDSPGTTTMVGFVGLVLSYFLSVLRYSQPFNLICGFGTILVGFGVHRIVMT